jgi:predicted transcriptional regulator
MGVYFACKPIELGDIVKCSFDLNKTEFSIFIFFMDSDGSAFSVKDVADNLSFDRSTVQKAIKSLIDRDIIRRSQSNLGSGGYLFTYSINSKEVIKKKILENIDLWHNSIKKLISNW